jgi:hypothetical protein
MRLALNPGRAALPAPAPGATPGARPDAAILGG